MLTIPLKPIPSQALNVVLAQQYCTINLYQKSTGLYFDLLIDNTPIVTCVIVRDRLNLVSEAYHGFIGNLMIVDLQEKADPQYLGLGERWVLVYLGENE